MTENRPVAVRHDAEYFRNLLHKPVAAGPIVGQPQTAEIKAPQIAHYSGQHRPMVTTAPVTPIRLSRGEIERALVGSHTYAPHQDEIIDRIVLETARMDGFAENSPPFKAHHEAVLRLLREIGPYPV